MRRDLWHQFDFYGVRSMLHPNRTTSFCKIILQALTIIVEVGWKWPYGQFIRIAKDRHLLHFFGTQIRWHVSLCCLLPRITHVYPIRSNKSKAISTLPTVCIKIVLWHGISILRNIKSPLMLSLRTGEMLKTFTGIINHERKSYAKYTGSHLDGADFAHTYYFQLFIFDVIYYLMWNYFYGLWNWSYSWRLCPWIEINPRKLRYSMELVHLHCL